MRSQQLMVVILFIYECISMDHQLGIFYRFNGESKKAIEVPSDCSVTDLQSAIQKEIESMSSLTLTFQGATLTAGSSLADSGITSEAVIDVTVNVFQMVFEEHTLDYDIVGDKTATEARQVRIPINQDITQQIIDAFPDSFTDTNPWCLRDSNGQHAKLLICGCRPIQLMWVF